MLVKNNSGKKINITAKIPIPFSKASDYCNFLTSTIVLDNRDIFELLIMKKPELLNCDRLLTGYKPLHVAATNCKIDIVKSLLDNGVDINARTKKLSTYLILLSQDGGFWYKNSIISELKYVLEERTKLFKFLLNHGADPNLVNKDGDSSLSFASSWNNKKIVQLLLNFSNINVNIKNLEGDTPLHISVYHDHLDIVKLLLTKGANPNLANNNGVTPLHNAAFNSNLEIVKLLVDYGANINAENKDGIVALRDAVKNGHTKIVRFLLEKGANVNIQIIEDATPFNGQIHFVDNKNIKLLNKYKDAVTKRKGWFILHYAVYTGNLEIVKLLLDHGANINVIDIYGVTPIYVAACKNYIEIIKLLLSSEPNTNIIIPIENISVPLLKNKKIIIFDETIDGKKPINLYYENEEIQNFLKKFNELNKKINICKNFIIKR